MTETNTLQPLWDQLIGEDLSGVVFVRDYLQLQFNPPPQVNVYSACVVVLANGATAKFGEEPFANLILSLIGRVVSAVHVVDDQFFRIGFADGSAVEISLRPGDYHGPEAVGFQGREGRSAVI
jgi:hypothetical protein